MFVETLKGVRFRIVGTAEQAWNASMDAYRAARRLGDREAIFVASTGPVSGGAPPVRFLPENLAVLQEMAGEPRQGVLPGTLAPFLWRLAHNQLWFGDRPAFDATLDELRRLAAAVNDSLGAGRIAPSRDDQRNARRQTKQRP